MRNFKKVIAVVVTLVMLLGVVGISSSAATAATIKLSGRTQARVGDTYELTVSVEGTVGAVEGIIAYTGATYVSAEEGASVKANENGTLSFVGLASEADKNGKLFTLTFTLDSTASNAKFEIAACKGANVEGTGYVEVAKTNAELDTYPDIVTVDYAELKADASDPDLRFKLTYNLDELAKYDSDASVKEYGVLIGLSKSLGSAELTLEKENESYIVKASATPDDSFTGAVTVYANISNSHGENKSLLGVRVIARAYIVLNDGNDTVIYSNNDSDYVGNGTSTRSMIGCAKIAAGQIYSQVADTDATRLKYYSEYTDVLPYEVPAEATEKNPYKLSKTELLSLIQSYKELFFKKAAQ